MSQVNAKNSFQLDNRSSLELQNFVLQFAALLKIENNEIISNWQQYLLQNIGFRLAFLLTVDSDSIKEHDIKEYVVFITKTEKYFEEKAVQQEGDELIKKISKDFKDLIGKNLNIPQKTTIQALKNFYQQLQVNLLADYQESLYIRANHAPDIGLLFTFINLFHQYLIPDINLLPEKLTQFYYKSIIQKKRLPTLPDIAHVYFEPAKFVQQSTLEKGIALYAGRDNNNNNIVFKTQDTVHLSQAELMDIKTLYFTNPETPSTQGIFKKQVFFEAEYNNFETFGKNIALYKKPEVENVADFGFAVASKILYLKEGIRTITISLPDLADANEQLLELLKENCFFEITTKDGWYSVETISIKIIITDNEEEETTSKQIQMQLKLAQEFAPIAPFLSFANLPAIRCLLRKTEFKNGNRVACYNQLKNIQLNPQKIQLEVAAEGIQDLTCYNDLGILNISQPFHPFGATPSKYSKFVIGSAEVFQKSLKEINLQLDWKLPQWNFKTYFKAYAKHNSDISDSSKYKIKFNATRDATTQSLFHEELSGEHRKSSIKTTIDNPYITPKEWATELPPYSRDTKWGYIEMQLIAPSNPFGTGLYQQVIASQIGKIRNQEDDKDDYLINPPMMPELTGIQLSYKTKADTKGDKENHQFYHIHPFGKELIINEESSLLTQKYTNQLSKKNQQGILLLGIKNLTAGLISIYFELAGSSLIPSNSKTTVLPPNFFLVSDNKFEPITKVADATEGFEQSGIIQLNIPSLIGTVPQSSILPASLDWIAVVVDENAESFGLTNRIHLHGTKATRVLNTHAENKYQEISLGNTITRTLEMVPDVRKVFQPIPSFNGRNIEQTTIFSKRIATNIRHRQRPSKTKDIEAIIYNEFPQVNQCRVFLDGKKLRVVIIPLKKTGTLRPAFPISFLIKVRNFIQHIVATFLEVIVENPHYAILQTHSYFSLKNNGINLDLSGIAYALKEQLIQQLLNPWSTNKVHIGSTLDMLSIKKSIEKTHEHISFEDFIYYYYYIYKNKRFFHFFNKFAPLQTLDTNVIFIPDETPTHHKVLLSNSKWRSHKSKLLERQDEEKPILGFDTDYRLTSKRI